MRKMSIAAVVVIAGLLVFAPLSQAGAVSLPPGGGTYMAWLGTVDFNDDSLNDYTEAYGDNIWNNYIMQTITAASFTIWYNFYSWDYYPYDEPGFAIYDGDTELFAFTADDVDTDPVDGYGLDWTGWQSFTYDWGESAEHTLYFFAGNTGDDGVQSWVYLDLGTPFTNGGFETGDLTGWEYEGQAGVIGGDSAVPIPAAVWLLGSGLFGLVGLKRRLL